MTDPEPYRCLCPDLPGHGAAAGKSENAGADMEQTAALLLRRLEEHNISHCALAGYSMGGRVALYLAVRHPERFTRLLLESASPGIADTTARLERLRQDRALARRLSSFSSEPAGFGTFLDDWYGQPLFASLQERPELLKELIARRRENEPRQLGASLLGLGTGAQPDLWGELPSVTMPVLLVTGARDAKFDAIAASMAARLPCARREVFQDSGHCPHEENPTRFAEVFRRVLDTTSV